MTTDENIMIEMLDRATNSAKDTTDELSVQMFCMIVRSNSQLQEKAQDLIMSKIRSNDVTQATKAIALLEECMNKCGTEFQDEIAKFRFLNQLIRLVSMKYLGAETAAEVKQRIMDCLLLWTTEFPQKSKIREVYDMLKKEGGVEQSNSTASAFVPKRESVLGTEDEEMFQKLLKSRDPEDLKRANLLIQSRFNQQSRHRELQLNFKSVLQEVETTVTLLNQMLDTYESDGANGVSRGDNNREDTISLMRDLYMACKKHKPVLQRLPDFMANETDQTLIVETVETNDLLFAVMKRYKNTIVNPTVASSATPVQTTEVSTTTRTDISSKNTDLLAELLNDETSALKDVLKPNDDELLAPITVTAGTDTAKDKTATNTFDDLNEIFCDISKNAVPATNVALEDDPQCQPLKNLSEIFGNLDLLEPVTVFPSTATAASASITNEDEKLSNGSSSSKSFYKHLPEIDHLSDEMFKKTLPATDRIGSFKKDPEKYTLNDLAKEKSIPKTPLAKTRTPPKPKTNVVESSGKSTDEKCLIEDAKEDDLILSTDMSANENASNNTSDYKTSTSTALPVDCVKQEMPIKHLSEIQIDLDNCTPSSEERLLMDDDDVKITLNFTDDHPSKHVRVIVLTASNKSTEPVKDFHFEASVKKPSKVRLLPRTEHSMEPYKKFRPSTPINQIMLLLNPTGKSVDVTCIVGYKLGDDPDEIKESIVVKDIAFVE